MNKSSQVLSFEFLENFRNDMRFLHLCSETLKKDDNSLLFIYNHCKNYIRTLDAQDNNGQQKWLHLIESVQYIDNQLKENAIFIQRLLDMLWEPKILFYCPENIRNNQNIIEQHIINDVRGDCLIHLIGTELLENPYFFTNLIEKKGNIFQFLPFHMKENKEIIIKMITLFQCDIMEYVPLTLHQDYHFIIQAGKLFESEYLQWHFIEYILDDNLKHTFLGDFEVTGNINHSLSLIEMNLKLHKELKTPLSSDQTTIKKI